MLASVVEPTFFVKMTAVKIPAVAQITTPRMIKGRILYNVFPEAPAFLVNMKRFC